MKALLLIMLLPLQAFAAEPILVTATHITYGWNGMYLCSLTPEDAQAMMHTTAEKNLKKKADGLCGGEAVLEASSLTYSARCENTPGYAATMTGLFRCKESQ